MRPLLASLLAALLVLFPAAAAALEAPPADPVAERARQRLVEGTPGVDAPLSMAAELGTALSRGNTETLHLHLDARVRWVPWERWVSTTVGKALYEESRDDVVANSWMILERLDRYVSSRVSLFTAAGWERNIFAGIDRRISGQLGVGFLALDRRDPAREGLNTDRLELEAGGYVASEYRVLSPVSPPDAVLEDDRIDIVAARLAASYKHQFRKGSEVGVSVEEIEDFVDLDNRVVNAAAWAASALVEGLSIKLSLGYRFDNVPASPELEKHDFLLTGGIVVAR